MPAVSSLLAANSASFCARYAASMQQVDYEPFSISYKNANRAELNVAAGAIGVVGAVGPGAFGALGAAVARCEAPALTAPGETAPGATALREAESLAPGPASGPDPGLAALPCP